MDPIEVPRLPRPILVFPCIALPDLTTSETLFDVEDLLFVVELLVGLGAVERFGFEVGGGSGGVCS
jgi:hypothetical protein